MAALATGGAAFALCVSRVQRQRRRRRSAQHTGERNAWTLRRVRRRVRHRHRRGWRSQTNNTAESWADFLYFALLQLASTFFSSRPLRRLSSWRCSQAVATFVSIGRSKKMELRARRRRRRSSGEKLLFKAKEASRRSAAKLMPMLDGGGEQLVSSF